MRRNNLIFLKEFLSFSVNEQDCSGANLTFVYIIDLPSTISLGNVTKNSLFFTVGKT